MSTDITRGPKICPSCGRENPPTAAHCAFCSTPLGGAIQTTPTPAWGEVRVSPDPDARPISRPALKGCAALAGGTFVAFLAVISGLVTFFAVCTGANVAYQSISPPNPVVGIFLGVVLGILAAVLVGSLIVVAFHRSGWR